MKTSSKVKTYWTLPTNVEIELSYMNKILKSIHKIEM